MVPECTESNSSVRRWRLLLVVSVCALLTLGCVACAGERSASETPEPPDSGQTLNDDEISNGESSGGSVAVPGEGSRLAGSLDEYIDSLIADTEWTTDYEREILERAKANGGVSVTDYEQTWSRYKQCMLDKGYKEIILVKFPNGIYHEASYRGGTERQMAKYHKDVNICMADVGAVAQVYQMQIGNPTLFSDKNEAIVDCFRRNNLVPLTYTAQQYAQERAEGEYTIDRQDMEIRGCEVANGLFASYVDDPVEQLW